MMRCPTLQNAKALLAFGLVTFLACGGAGAATIHAPVVNQFSDATDNLDRWFMVADASGTVSVDVYTQAGLLGASVSLHSGGGTVSAFASAGTTTSLSLTGLAPGSLAFLDVSQAQFGYRPTFNGVSHVYIEEASNSPNDLVNFGAPITHIGSNIVLGYADTFATLPGVSAETRWFYDLDPGDTFSWSGFFDDWPIGLDALQIEIFDPSGVSQQTFVGPSLLGSGTTFNGAVGGGQGGFWSVALTAPSDFLTAPPGNYLMDVTVNGDPNSEASNRHYLLPSALPAIPEPTTSFLVGLGALTLLGRGARRTGRQLCPR